MLLQGGCLEVYGFQPASRQPSCASAVHSCGESTHLGWGYMAKRGTTESKGGKATADASGEVASEAMEQRLVALAEQLGRLAGTVQARAEGWLDSAALNKQLAGVRDSAAGLLAQLGGVRKKAPARKAAAAAPGAAGKARSGGLVDAPGKKHRKPLPPDPDVKRAASQAAKVRAAKTMVKTSRNRGRG